MIVKDAARQARFRPDRMAKTDLLQGRHLFVGLNAFEPGQRHEPHAHCDRDKLYLVLAGAGQLTLGDRTERIGPGDVALAPAGVVHALDNAGPERLVVIAILAPPPAP